MKFGHELFRRIMAHREAARRRGEKPEPLYINPEEWLEIRGWAWGLSLEGRSVRVLDVPIRPERRG
jgi:hypothetical protein